jgi:3-hydroxyacyl-CoA dehydrogenase/enoyl-CoA hydratase/3-hydroxybutyryl-CoA epimerase
MGAFSTERENGIAIVTFDLPGESVNKISRAVKDELAAVMRELESDGSVRAIVLRSGKPENFIAGADIEEFVAARTEHEFRALSREGQQFLDRLAASRQPVVVAVHGACLGGGLELALACRYRVASDHPKTVFGLPEVQLGIIPGAGGCNRLPRLVGLRTALDMILTGRNVKARRALRMGLVDEVVPNAILMEVAIGAAKRLASGQSTPRRGPRGMVAWLLDRSAPGQALVLARARQATLGKTGGHYPAPLAALDAVRYGLANGMEQGLPHEAEQFARMAVTDVSRRLVEIFFATAALKKDPGVEPPVPEARKVENLAVLGAGFMGSGIAFTAADVAGVPTRMKDADLSRVGKGLKAVAELVGEKVKRGSITRLEGARTMALVSGGVDYSGFRRADLVIEAVFEDLEVKRTVLREVESVVGPECVFASNTSTLPISQIAQTSRRPENVIGMHFFSPVHRMPLLELIVAEKTSKQAVVTALAFGRSLGKTVVVVRDSPGFFVNRILAPYVSEAGHLLSEGASIETVDGAMSGWGFPVGPVTLLDEVGLDVAVKVAQVMHGALGDRLKPVLRLDALVAEGRLGRKSGRGFFRYDKGKKRGADPGLYAMLGLGTPSATQADGAEVAERLSLAMLNEAARALEEDVIRQPRDGDIAAIFGIGFPPFRGGPYRTLDSLGPATVLESLEGLAERHGARFAPADIIRDLARRGGRFYPQD